MSSPTFPAFEVAPLPPGSHGAVYLQPGTLGRWGPPLPLQPSFKQRVTGGCRTKQQHTLVVVTRQEGQWVESKRKAQSTFVETLRSEPVNSPMQIFPLGL